MILCAAAFAYLQGVKVGLKIHNRFMQQWNQAKAEGRL